MPELRLATRSPLALTILACLFLLHSSEVEASQVRMVNVEEMTERAAKIFSGRCIDVRTERDPELRRHVTLVTFEVDLVVKGDVGAELTIKMTGNSNALSQGRGRLIPSFQVGEEVILFLYGESSSGMTSPVGFGQGKFTVVELKDGQKRAINGFGNRNLLHNLPDQSKAVAARAMAGLRSEREVGPDALLEMVRQLRRGPAKQGKNSSD